MKQLITFLNDNNLMELAIAGAVVIAYFIGLWLNDITRRHYGKRF